MQHSKMKTVTESGKQTGVLPQQPQHGVAPALLSTRQWGEVLVWATPGTVSLFNPAQNHPSRKGGYFSAGEWVKSAHVKSPASSHISVNARHGYIVWTRR